MEPIPTVDIKEVKNNFKKKPKRELSKDNNSTHKNYKKPLDKSGLSKKSEALIVYSEAEFKRAGRFELIFPCKDAAVLYKSFFEEDRPLNWILSKRLGEKT